jgi:sulfoxide reductase heme-binding subunit YedZ
VLAAPTLDRFFQQRSAARAALKPLAFILCLVPLAILIADGLHDQLGTNPIEEITHRTGDWTLRLLLVTLAVTPLRRSLGWNFLLRLRRLFGLFAFFYASLHFLTYVWLDQFFALGDIAKDVAKRPFITVGFTAFVMLIPLAATSTNRMMRRLGRRWQQLHRSIYLIATLGVVHYWWLVKADVRRPLLYGAVLAVLLLYRVVARARAAPAGRKAAGAEGAVAGVADNQAQARSGAHFSHPARYNALIPLRARPIGDHMATVEVTKDTFEDVVTKNDMVLVDFWAPWCAPCRSFAPVYEQLSEKYPGIVFAKVNTEEEQELAGAFQIRSIPTLMVFREKVILFSQPGALPATSLEQVITQAQGLDMEQVHREVAEQSAKPAE